MGLPLVKGIITTHGGNVDLYSVPGKGTQVMLQLPMAARSNHADGH
jgi:signal transduction histidine kinase